MNKEIKLSIDLFGILLSLVSLALLIAEEKHVASTVVTLILIGLVCYAIALARSKPYKIKTVEWSYKFLNAGDRTVVAEKVVTLVPIEKNVTTIDDSGIPASGTIDNISTNGWKFVVQQEGGATSVKTILHAPLALGQEYRHRLNYTGINCFTEKTENVVHTIISNIDLATIRITFPQELRPLHFSITHKIGMKIIDITNSHLKKDGLVYIFQYEKPSRGSVFKLEWNWS